MISSAELSPPPPRPGKNQTNENTIFLQNVQFAHINCVLGGEADQGGEVPPLADLRPSQPVQVLSRKEINHFLSPFDLS